MNIMKYIVKRFADIAELYLMRPVAFKLIGLGVVLLISGVSIDWRYISNDTALGTFAIGSAEVSAVFQWVLIITGLVLTGIGLKWSWDVQKKLHRNKVIVLEVRSLRITADTPLVESIPRSIIGHKSEKLFDVRNKIYGAEYQIIEAIDEINTIPLQLRTEIAGKDRADISVCAGGLAAVPLLVLLGSFLSAQSKCHLIDWNRFSSKWEPLIEGVAKEFTYEKPIKAGDSSEIVMLIPMSYPIDKNLIHQAFSGLPTYSLIDDQLGLGEFLDEDSLQAFINTFANTLVNLGALGYKVVHMVAVVPTTVAISLGRIYDGRNMPEIIIYQYQREQRENPYPWGIQLPTSEPLRGVYKSSVNRPIR